MIIKSAYEDEYNKGLVASVCKTMATRWTRSAKLGLVEFALKFRIKLG